MAPLSPTPTSSPPPASSTVDPFPPVSPISTASSPPSSPRIANDSSQPASPKRIDDGGLEEREIDWSKDYSLGFGMEFDTETAAMRSQRKIHEAQALNIAIAVDSGLSLKASHDLISAQLLACNGGKKLVSLFTDQDAAMAKAISIFMPGVTHGLCTFHLQQNALKHLGHLYKDDSDFGKDFSACVFEYIEEEELVQGWDALVKKYDLNENMWIKKTWGLREKWAHAYLKLSFTAGMRSTQLSESLNAKVKKYVKFDHDIVQFFTHFDRLVMEKREEESDSIYIILEKSCKDEMKQHHELEGSFKCVIRLHKRAKKRFLVSGNVKLDEFGDNICLDVRCSCRKFENFEILCGHAIKGLDRMGILEIPESYILGRWRLDAKDCASKGSNVSVEEKDPKLIKAVRYRNLCPKMVKLGARACHLKVAYNFVNTTVNYMCDTVDKMFLEEGDSIEEGIKKVDLIHSNLVQAKGLKRKTAPRKGGARLKPWHEKIGKRRRVASKPIHLSQDVSIPYIPEMINCGSNSQLTPSSSEMKLVNYGLNGSFFGIMDDFILEMQEPPGDAMPSWASNIQEQASNPFQIPLEILHCIISDVVFLLDLHNNSLF
ncbi:hypothetical protein RHSIM_Rhsim05G0058900 [Rhododendron simsii]|uniref:Protein FAR1-RELATED SEQUENCE n=1 Tax=Rhododendron simsii TaxID=118357 RepID=A0A834H418_RHOSS|nr:hypothetical protein RHSIM_Rhsim05G0058900 [Rhododendron simsii]